MYSAFILPGFFVVAINENAGITEHSVFPEPVGAMISESFFCIIDGTAFFWISVSCVKPRELNLARTESSCLLSVFS
jgi:hypothetical protein